RQTSSPNECRSARLCLSRGNRDGAHFYSIANKLRDDWRGPSGEAADRGAQETQHACRQAVPVDARAPAREFRHNGRDENVYERVQGSDESTAHCWYCHGHLELILSSESQVQSHKFRVQALACVP